MKKVFLFLGLALLVIGITAILGDAVSVFTATTMIMAAAPVAVITGSPSHIRLKALSEKRGKLHKDMKDINDLAVKEERGFTTDEDSKYQKMGDDYDTLNAEIRRLQSEIKRETDLAAIDLEIEEKRDNGETRDEAKEKYATAFRTWVMGGMQALNTDQANLMSAEMRTLSTGTGSQGGYTIPEGFVKKLEVALKAYGGIYAVANILKTATGNTLPWPTTNDTGNIGAILAENTDAGSSVDPTFGVVSFAAYTYSSKAIRVPNQLLQDSAFNLETYLADMMAVRIGRIINQHFTTGTGSAQPNGLVTAATSSGITAAAVAAITFDEMIDLFHSVDRSYRMNGKWMFADSTLKALRKLKDGDSRPIWQLGYSAGEPATILGKPYQINDDMAAMAASAKAILFGDMSKYNIREVAGGTVQRAVERFVDYNQTGFYLFKRFDGDLIDAGTHPVKYLTMAAS